MKKDTYFFLIFWEHYCLRIKSPWVFFKETVTFKFPIKLNSSSQRNPEKGQANWKILLENAYFCSFFKHKHMAVDLLARIGVIPIQLLRPEEKNTLYMWKKTTGTFNIYSRQMVDLPLLGFYYWVQTTVPEVAQISNKSWLRFKGARASLWLQVQRLHDFLFHINLMKLKRDNFSHTVGIFSNLFLLQGHLSENGTLSP